MQKKLWVFFLCLLSLTSYALAQSTTVSVTVVDATGQAWAGGTISPVFVKRQDFNGPYFWNNNPLLPQYLTPQTIQLDSNGSATFTLPTSNAILPGSSWSYTVCPNASTSCTSVNIPTTGGTQDISSTVNAALNVILVNGSPIPKAYSDNQIKTVPGIGFMYYNVISNTIRIFNGSTWGSISGNAVPGGSTGQIQTNNSGILAGVTPTTPLHSTPTSFTIDQANLAQPGYIGVSDFSAIPGISPVGKETSGYNGVQNILSSQTLCPNATPCSVQVPNTYPVNSFQGLFSNGNGFGWVNGFSGSGQKIMSSQGGQNKFFCNNPTAINNYDAATCMDAETLFFAYDGKEHDNYKSFLIDSAPGYNNGYYGTQTNAIGGWSGHFGIRQDLIFQGSGIKGGIDQTISCPGTGDCHNYWYLACYGGFRAPGDEGCQIFAAHNDQSISFYKGTVTSSIGSQLVNTNKISGTFQDLGQQHLAVDISSGSLIASGYATATANYLGYELVTIAGATVTPSKYWGTLNANIDVPTVPTSYLGTLTTFGLTITGGGGTTPAAGQFINLSQPYSETVKVVSVTGTAPNFQITAYVRRNHIAGYTEFESTYGHGAFSYTANTSSANNVPYYYDMVGQTDSTHVVLVPYLQGLVANMELGNVQGNVTFASVTADSLVNTGGVVTASFYSNYPDRRYYGYPTITFRGSAVAAFNGQCTNVRNFRSVAGGKVGFDCDQSASTGMSSPYPDNSNITFGDTGYGNTRFTAYEAAEILDVTNTPSVPGCYSGAAGACNPSVNGQLHLETNAMSLANGDTIIVPIDYSMLMDTMDIYSFQDNPSVQGNNLSIASGGPGTNANRSFINVQNYQSINSFQGMGGDQSIPHHGNTRGIFANYWEYDTPPAPGGSMIFVGSCNPGPFTCASMYPYFVYYVATNGGSMDIQLNPATNTTKVDSTNIILNGLTAVPITTIASATTVSATTNIVTISGTGAIATINISSTFGTYPHANDSNIVLGTCFDALSSGTWTTTTSGNIYATMTATSGSYYRFCYLGDQKWHVK